MQYENCSGRLQNTVNELMHMQEMSMKKKGSSRIGLFGEIKHYDKCGHKTGESRWGLFGDLKHYDKKGKKIGHSDRGIFGDWKNYIR